MKTIVLAVVAIIMAAITPSWAMGKHGSQEAVTIEIISESGKKFQSIPHNEFWKSNTHVFRRFLEAEKGARYGILLRNNTPDRIAVVIAVDGRNIISGKESNLGRNERMYVLESWQSAQYDGWRTSNDQVHRFYFTDAADSYSVKTFDDASAMGVIAVAVYKEKERPQLMYKQKREAPAAASKNSADSLASERAGTGFGEATYSPVIHVQFDPQSSPVQKTLIKYEWREVLCKKGILQCGKHLGNRLWDESNYAPYPPGYNN